jgi:hypothetical protein
MKVLRLELKEANEYVLKNHRHHKPVTGHRFSFGVEVEGKLIGVCIVGRPVSRKTDQKNVCEVLRCCTDGTKNACSFLYSNASKIAKLLGFELIQTFILESEHGSSLKASNWEFISHSKGGSWNSKSRDGRREDQPMCKKQKWGRYLKE